MAMAMVAPLLLLLLLLPSAEATAGAVNHMGRSDRELAARKMQCYQDIDNGLWGYACKSLAIQKENCALNCVSSLCYESVYANDPLEEGEVDLRRGREFKVCIRGIGNLTRPTSMPTGRLCTTFDTTQTSSSWVEQYRFVSVVNPVERATYTKEWKGEQLVRAKSVTM